VIVPVLFCELRLAMPTIEENVRQWNVTRSWPSGGEQWSGAWGNSNAQWYGCIYPRIQRFVPAPTILELAPGFGRWTRFLLEQCDTYIGVDVSSKCTEACAERFSAHTGASFYTNDGSSLPMVADSSVDFAFSFDSFVHVEADTLASYLKELARVLTPEGAGFIHHSNSGAYERLIRTVAPLQLDRLPRRVRLRLERIGVMTNVHWRATSVTAARFVESCQDAGLHCVGQELVNWGGGIPLIDAMSVVTRPGSRWDRPNRVVRNWLFRTEARAIRRSISV